MYVLRRDSDGAYVARPGKGTYTLKLEEAAVFKTREAAKRECMENERVISLDSIFNLE